MIGVCHAGIPDASYRPCAKFKLTKIGKSQIKNVVTDPATGSTYLDTAVATRAT